VNFNNIVNDILNEGILDFFKKESKIDYDSLINQYKEDLKNFIKDAEWVKHTDYQVADMNSRRGRFIPKTSTDDEIIDNSNLHLAELIDLYAQCKNDRKRVKNLMGNIRYYAATQARALLDIFHMKKVDWDIIYNDRYESNSTSDSYLDEYRENTKTRKSYLRTGLSPSVDKTFGDLIDEL
jgi:hypothetical protein